MRKLAATLFLLAPFILAITLAAIGAWEAAMLLSGIAALVLAIVVALADAHEQDATTPHNVTVLDWADDGQWTA